MGCYYFLGKQENCFKISAEIFTQMLRVKHIYFNEHVKNKKTIELYIFLKIDRTLSLSVCLSVCLSLSLSLSLSHYYVQYVLHKEIKQTRYHAYSLTMKVMTNSINISSPSTANIFV